MACRWIVDVKGRATAALIGLALTGCSSGGGGIAGIGQGPLPYQHSNAFGAGGFSESILAPDRYRIEVKGPANTSRQRMEKIAAARAAEIGRENRQGFFKVENVQHTTTCQTVKPGQRSPNTGGPKTFAYAITTAEVSYAKTPPDPSYRDSRQSFDALRAELDQDQTAPLPLDPAAVAQCAG